MGRLNIHLHGRASSRSIASAMVGYMNRMKGKVRLIEHSDKLDCNAYMSTLENLGGNLILLDESGEQMSSRGFSSLLSSLSLESEDTHLAIGPADGFPTNHGKRSISLSLLTMPHELAALVLIEQVYRASEIERGSSYHRD